MNPIVAQQLKEISNSLEELKKELVHAQGQVEELTALRDELQKKSWAQAREIHVLKERLDETVELKEDNERLRKLTDDFQKRMQEVLRHTRALATELRP